MVASRGDWAAEVARLAPDGAHAVYDSIGTTLLASIRIARTGGTVVFYGMAAGDPIARLSTICGGAASPTVPSAWRTNGNGVAASRTTTKT